MYLKHIFFIVLLSFIKLKFENQEHWHRFYEQKLFEKYFHAPNENSFINKQSSISKRLFQLQ